LKTDTPNEDDQGFFGALMISDEVYVEIKVLRKQGLSLRQIASEVGCAVNTVRAHLAAPEMPRYEYPGYFHNRRLCIIGRNGHPDSPLNSC
jgi:hypothetical protein